jgi:hypothetical protein
MCRVWMKSINGHVCVLSLCDAQSQIVWVPVVDDGSGAADTDKVVDIIDSCTGKKHTHPHLHHT